MLKKFRTVGLCLVVMFALGAVGASGAMASSSGPYLKVRGTNVPEKTLESGETITVEGRLETGTIGKLYVGELHEGGPFIECTAASGSGSGGNSWHEGVHSEGVLISATVVFEGCTVVEAPHCIVESTGATQPGQIVVSNLAGRLGYKPGESEKEREEGKGVEGYIHPATGTTFTTVDITKCALAEEYEVTGGAVGTGGPVNEFLSAVTLGAKVIEKSPTEFLPELECIEFPEWNEKEQKSEPEVLHGVHLEYGKHLAALEGKIELYNPKLNGTEPVEVGVFTTP